jgi:hypothetical protein
VSTGLRQRTNCQACGARCQATALELQVHRDSPQGGYWLYTLLRLCPPCRAAQLDFLLRGVTAA